VTAAQVNMRAPAVVAPTYIDGAKRDASDLGTFVRSRQEQLRFCYAERGLKVNPNLAGTINVSITLTSSGNVTDAKVTNRTWSGSGAAEAESCIVQKIRNWRFPSASAGGGTYAFPFNFTR
jgi:TonB family protein